MKIDLNCDLGEGFGAWEMGNDAAMIELATSVNIACGFHASDEMLNKLTLEEKAFGDYTPKRFAWILQDPVAFKKPIAARGRLALWEFDEGLIEESPD